MLDSYNALRTDHEAALSEKLTLQSAYNDLRLNAAGFLALNAAGREAALEAAGQIEEASELEKRVATLNAEAETLTDQIAEMQESIIRIAGESRTFPAGVLYAGTDFEPGRYRVYGGSSNFFVERGGRNVVNIILSGRHGVSEYIFTFRSGDVIEARSAFRMIPVE